MTTPSSSNPSLIAAILCFLVSLSLTTDGLMMPGTIVTQIIRVSHNRKLMPLIAAPRQMSASSASSYDTTVYPRAAVSVVVRFQDSSLRNHPVRWLLIRRGNEPNKGVWSFPGGKIESLEGTLEAAKRELREETGLCSNNKNKQCTLKWHDDGPFACSDSIGGGYHYVISQCFAEVIASSMPHIEASDDAMDAKWWSVEEVEVAESKGIVTRGVLRVVKRSETLYQKGLLQ